MAAPAPPIDLPSATDPDAADRLRVELTVLMLDAIAQTRIEQTIEQGTLAGEALIGSRVTQQELQLRELYRRECARPPVPRDDDPDGDYLPDASCLNLGPADLKQMGGAMDGLTLPELAQAEELEADTRALVDAMSADPGGAPDLWAARIEAAAEKLSTGLRVPRRRRLEQRRRQTAPRPPRPLSARPVYAPAEKCPACLHTFGACAERGPDCGGVCISNCLTGSYVCAKDAAEGAAAVKAGACYCEEFERRARQYGSWVYLGAGITRAVGLDPEELTRPRILLPAQDAPVKAPTLAAYVTAPVCPPVVETVVALFPWAFYGPCCPFPHGCAQGVL